jgi:uncharacterized protein YkwD
LALKGIVTSTVLSAMLLGVGLLVTASAAAILYATDSLVPLFESAPIPAQVAPSSDLLSASLTPTPFQPAPLQIIGEEKQPDMEVVTVVLTEGDTPAVDPTQFATDASDENIAPSETSIQDTETPTATSFPSPSKTQPRYVPLQPTATRTKTPRPAATATQNQKEPKNEIPSSTNQPTEVPPSPTSTEIPTEQLTTESQASVEAPIEGEGTNTNIPPTPTPTKTSTPIPPTPLPTNTQKPSPTVSGCAVVYNPDFENRVLALINEQRAAVGLKALSRNSALDSSARAHSVDQAVHQFLAHTGSDGSTFWQRAVRAGYTGHWGGEIIYSGGGAYGTPEQAVTWWMNDPPHKDMIVGALDDFGAGYAYCPSGHWGGFITVDFGHR